MKHSGLSKYTIHFPILKNYIDILSIIIVYLIKYSLSFVNYSHITTSF